MITTLELRELRDKTTPAPWYVSLAPEYIGAPEEHSVVFVDSVSSFIASTHLPPTEQRALDDAALIATEDRTLDRLWVQHPALMGAGATALLLLAVVAVAFIDTPNY